MSTQEQLPQFDIVIPLGPSDVQYINIMVHYTKQNVIGYRNIYIVSYDPTITVDGCIVIDERIFPFQKDDIGAYVANSHRTGWYLQQLLKLYAGVCVPGILNHYLVIDSDTFFVKPTQFFDHMGLALYNAGTEYYSQYFDHMRKLHPSLKKQTNYSGITHHMMFCRDLIQELFAIVEAHTGDVFWRSFMANVAPPYYEWSGASEYEIYFNYLLIYHSDKIKIRPLGWVNSHERFPQTTSPNYVSYHWYSRGQDLQSFLGLYT